MTAEMVIINLKINKSADYICIVIDSLLRRTNQSTNLRFELPHDKTNKMACAPMEDQPGHLPSLI